MEQQIEATKENLQSNYNLITIFLSKFIFGANFDSVKKLGLVDTYTEDPSMKDFVTLPDQQKFLFLLIKNKKMTSLEIKKIISELAQIPIKVLFSYELINDYLMIVIEFPQEFKLDYDNVIAGRYSKLSEQFKLKFPKTKDVFNKEKKRVGSEYTLYYHVFNKTEWLKSFWLKRLMLAELDDSLELWSKPDQQDLIFNIQNISK
jgi:hypothetical protein